MVLAFMQEFKGKTTHFIEKIHKGIFFSKMLCDHRFFQQYRQAYWAKFGKHLSPNTFKPKLHTIRVDSKNRWRPGSLIHFVINRRKRNQFQFAPIIKCISVQKIEIKYLSKTSAEVYVDNKQLYYDKVYELARNDGFDSVDDFFEYFSEDFTGKIIHWTDLKY